MTHIHVEHPDEPTPNDVYVVPQEHGCNEIIASQDWVPGEPLYSYASGVYSRPLFQVVPDVDTGTAYDKYWCHDCDVQWACPDYEYERVNLVTSSCWMCGREAEHPNDQKESQRRTARVKVWWS